MVLEVKKRKNNLFAITTVLSFNCSFNFNQMPGLATLTKPSNLVAWALVDWPQGACVPSLNLPTEKKAFVG